MCTGVGRSIDPFLVISLFPYFSSIHRTHGRKATPLRLPSPAYRPSDIVPADTSLERKKNNPRRLVFSFLKIELSFFFISFTRDKLLLLFFKRGF